MKHTKSTGINVSGHDSSIAVVRDDQILFASHSERYSGIKNDASLFWIDDIVSPISPLYIGRVAISDKPFPLHIRERLSGERTIFDFSPTRIDTVAKHSNFKTYVGHHLSHVSAGYFTSGFDDAVAICIDAIGELDTITLWECNGDKIKRIRFTNSSYPNSLGLLYTAFTAALGLKPNSEEYVLMSMASLGKPIYYDDIMSRYVSHTFPFVLKDNIHRGITLNITNASMANDMAASIQKVFEDVLLEHVDHFLTMHVATYGDTTRNLIMCGGSALNCVANTKVAELEYFSKIWIYFNPGDAGNALGAALYDTKSRPFNAKNPFLGYKANDITDQIPNIVTELETSGKAGVLHDRAEFGPRALGHRSILADPRLSRMKAEINAIKGRPLDRPFAASILEEHADKHFVLNACCDYSYMQYAVPFVGGPSGEMWPPIRHADTCRVQVVKKDNPDFKFIRAILEEWYERTGCPILLHTSLNVKGQPIVNSADQLRFGNTLKVFS